VCRLTLLWVFDDQAHKRKDTLSSSSLSKHMQWPQSIWKLKALLLIISSGNCKQMMPVRLLKQTTFLSHFCNYFKQLVSEEWFIVIYEVSSPQVHTGLVTTGVGSPSFQKAQSPLIGWLDQCVLIGQPLTILTQIFRWNSTSPFSYAIIQLRDIVACSGKKTRDYNQGVSASSEKVLTDIENKSLWRGF